MLALPQTGTGVVVDTDVAEDATAEDYVEALGWWSWADVEEDTENAWVVLFYSSKCTYSLAVQAAFYAVAEQCEGTDNKIKFGTVDTESQRYLTYLSGVERTPSALTINFDVADDGIENEIAGGQDAVEEIVAQLQGIC